MKSRWLLLGCFVLLVGVGFVSCMQINQVINRSAETFRSSSRPCEPAGVASTATSEITQLQPYLPQFAFLIGEWEALLPGNQFRMCVEWDSPNKQFRGYLTQLGLASMSVGFKLGELVWMVEPSGEHIFIERVKWRSALGYEWRNGNVELGRSSPDHLVSSLEFMRVNARIPIQQQPLQSSSPTDQNPDRKSSSRGKPNSIVAGSVSELAEKAMNEFRLRNDIVMVMFATQGDVSATLSKVKETMHTYDQHSVMNPYWVIGFPGEAVDTVTNCGVVVGHWYGSGGYPSRVPWERIMDGVLAREATSGTYLYSHKGEFMLTEDGQPEMDALQGICFPNSKLAAATFNSFGAGAGQSRPTISRTTQQPIPAQLAQIQAATKDLAAKAFRGDTFVGSACSKTLGLEISVTDVFLNNPKEQNDPLFLVRGSMKVARTSHSSLSIALVGAISRTNGVLNLAASNEGSKSLSDNVLISLFRDDDGIGWEGMIEGIGGNGCDDVRLTSKNGNRLNAFPKMTGDVAFNLSNPKMAPISPLYPLYWLKVAETRGSIDATYYLGELYEQRGVNSPQNYVLAFQYYQAAAKDNDDARAQAALGRMHEKGWGATVDVAKAKQWSGLARKTRQNAARVCTSLQLKDIIRRYSKQSHGQNKKATEAGKAITGISADMGEVTISKVIPEQVISLTKPFLCRAKGGLDNPNVQMEMPESEVTVWRDQYGRETTTDNSMDQLASVLTPLLINNAARNSTRYYAFLIDPLGKGRYKVSYQGSSGIESEVMDLN